MSKSQNTPPKIWVTQTLPRAEESAAAFRAIGLEAVVSPVLQIRISDNLINLPSELTVLLFTSRNGVRAFCSVHAEREFDVLCVGDETAKLARGMGFNQVSSAGGDVDDLFALVKKEISLSRPIRHCSGRHVRGRLTERLLESGYTATRIEYYASEPRITLDVEPSHFDYVAVYSPLAANNLAQLLALHNVERLTSLSISANTDDGLAGSGVGRRLIANSPNQAAMLATLRLDFEAQTGQI
jgi:uroporphyrinogen-III synthase